MNVVDDVGLWSLGVCVVAILVRPDRGPEVIGGASVLG